MFLDAKVRIAHKFPNAFTAMQGTRIFSALLKHNGKKLEHGAWCNSNWDLDFEEQTITYHGQLDTQTLTSGDAMMPRIILRSFAWEPLNSPNPLMKRANFLCLVIYF
jgi:hypothetical protein